MKKTIAVFMFLTCAFAVNAQDLIVTNDGESIKAYNIDISKTYVYYSLFPDDEGVKRISICDVLVIKKANGEKIIPEQADNITSKTESNPVRTGDEFGDPTLPNLDINSYKGFLLASGNVVYVTEGETEYEKAGIRVLKRHIKQDGFWKLADRPEQAHFYIVFHTVIDGADHVGNLCLRKRNPFTEKQIKSSEFGSYFNFFGNIRSDESVSGNIIAAKKLYDLFLKLQDDITLGKRRKWFSLFEQ